MLRTIRSTFTFIAVFALWLAIVASAGAASVTVCPAGPPACDHATIQAGVDAAIPGQWSFVIVAPGVYAESVSVSKQVVLTGNGRGIATFGSPLLDAEEAIITGDGSGPAVTIGAGANLAHLQRLVVQDVAAPHPAVRISGFTRMTNMTVRRSFVGVDVVAAGGDLSPSVTQVDVLDGLAVGTGVRARLAGARVEILNVRTTGYAGGTGIDVEGGMGNNIARLSVVRTADATTGIRVAELDDLVIASANVDVPGSGTGVSVESGLADLEFRDSEIVGAVGRPGTTGLRFQGGQAGFVRVDQLRVLDLATTVDIAANWGSGSTLLGGNHFRPLPGGVAINSASASPVRAEENWIACPGGCTHVAGAGNVDATPSLALRVAFAEPELLEGARVGVVADFVRDDGSGPPTTYPLVEATLASTLGTVLEPVHRVRSHGNHHGGPILVLDAFPRIGTATVTTEDGIAVSATASVVGRGSENVAQPTIVGTMLYGTRATCKAGSWQPAPEAFSYTWVGAEDERVLGTGQVFQVAPGIHQAVRCRVVASSSGRHASAAESDARTPDYPVMKVVVTPVNVRGRAIRCGGARVCAVPRRAGIRFRLATRPSLANRATLTLQRRVGRRWVRWAKGTVNVPYKGVFYVPSRSTPAGTYRLAVSAAARQHWLGGSASIVTWRVR